MIKNAWVNIWKKINEEHDVCRENSNAEMMAPTFRAMWSNSRGSSHNRRICMETIHFTILRLNKLQNGAHGDVSFFSLLSRYLFTTSYFISSSSSCAAESEMFSFYRTHHADVSKSKRMGLKLQNDAAEICMYIV